MIIILSICLYFSIGLVLAGMIFRGDSEPPDFDEIIFCVCVYPIPLLMAVGEWLGTWIKKRAERVSK